MALSDTAPCIRDVLILHYLHLIEIVTLLQSTNIQHHQDQLKKSHDNHHYDQNSCSLKEEFDLKMDRRKQMDLYSWLRLEVDKNQQTRHISSGLYEK